MMLELDGRLLQGTEGSGNQKKIWIKDCLYKVDSKFRDSTKEVSASNIADAFGLYHVTYKRIKCLIDNTEKWCSVCKSFLQNSGDSSINLYNLLSYYESFVVTNNLSAADYFNTTCSIISDFTGLDINYVKQRLLQILIFDFLIVNDDRHLRNIEIIMYHNGTFDIAPIFDNGHSFFRKDSVLTYKELEILSQKHKSKPFSTNQWKNLIDLKFAHHIASIWIKNAEQKYGSLYKIPGVLDSHKRILRYRADLLINKAL